MRGETRRLTASRAALVLAALAGPAAAPTAAQGVDMFPASRVVTNVPGPGTVAASDLDLDGVLDLVVGAGTSQFDPEQGWRVLLGRGDGTFEAGSSYPGPYNDHFALADFTGDGFPDLCGGEFNASPSEFVSVLPNLGDGTFGAPVETSLGVQHHTWELAPGDFDADGIDDLVVWSLGSVSTLRYGRGRGDGGFDPFVQLESSSSSMGSIAAADLDLDGRLDLIVGRNLRVRLGNGDGTFQAAIVNSTSTLNNLLVADLDDDGLPDVVGSQAVVFAGQGDGTLIKVEPSVPLSGETDGTLADLDGDGRLDLLACRPIDLGDPDTAGLLVRLGQPDLAFGPLAEYVTGGTPYKLATGDFDGDGALDVALSQRLFATFNDPTDVAVVFGRGDGSFDVPQRAEMLAPPLATELADMDGDGHLDLVATVTNALPAVRVALGAGDGTFGAPVGVDVGDNEGELAVADLDGNGALDLVVAGDPPFGATVVALGAGDGVTFGAPLQVATSDVADVRVADLDDDGAPDIAVTRTAAGVVTLYFGDGRGGFGAGVYLSAAGFPLGLTLADLNGDGRVDVATANPSSANVGVLLNLGGRAFAPPQSLPAPGGPLHIVAGDFDADGLADLATADEQPKRVSVFLGTGGGGFAAPTTSGVGQLSRSLAAADVNRDGLLDLVGAHGVEPTGFPPVEHDDELGCISLLLGRGDGTFLPRRLFYAGANPLDHALGDLDEDGFVDVAVGCNSVAGEVWVLPNLSGPWENLGFALPAPAGTPVLSGSGQPSAGETIGLLVTGVPAGSPGLLFVGVSTLMAPLKGGVLVPAPIVALPFPPLVEVHGAWSPGIPPGTPVYFQAWYAIAPASQVVATNALLTVGE